MKNFISLLVIFLLLFCYQINAQTRKPSTTSPKKVERQIEKEEFEKAIQNEEPERKILALEKFLERFPETKWKEEALKIISETQLRIAEKKLSNKDCCEDFKIAVKNLPNSIDDDFFARNLLKIPSSLFFNGYRSEALEIASLIEKKLTTNPKQLLSLATFYISIENADEAIRLAEKAIEIEKSSFGYQTLGLALRINFDLETAEKVFTKALEIEPNSITAKRNLADIKRAIGKSDEAISLYEEILQKSENDSASITGLILCLFDLGKITEAEEKLEKLQDQLNFSLFSGVAYKYVLRMEPEKAIRFADKAISIEPRYVWSYIAKARALLIQNKPIEAERTLLTARQYGNFPTLDYELAIAKYSSGFYREALEILQKNFEITEDGFIKTLVGNRVPKIGKEFSELTAYEISSSFLQPKPAEIPEVEEKLKQLLLFSKKLNIDNEKEIIEAAKAFIDDNDKTTTYRRIFVANSLLEKRKAISIIPQIVLQTLEKVEEAIQIDTPTSFVLSDALYESRKIAEAKGQMLLIQELPSQTILNILRGRIEELVGSALYEQNRIPEAIVRFKRAISILPENSVWWRSSLWRLGVCYEITGNLQAALDSYVKSYKSAEPDRIRYVTIENLYKRLYGSTEGLEQMLISKTKEDFLLKRVETLVNLEQTSKNEQRETSSLIISEQNKLETETTTNSEQEIEPSTTAPKNQKSTALNFPDTRPRIVKVEDHHQNICSLLIGQKEITILKNGGRLGVLVGYTDTKKDLSKLEILPSSPSDIKVEVETGIAKNQLFLVIKSISEQAGRFKIFLFSPCGNGEIIVNVR